MRTLLVAIATAAVASIVAAPALACGGFFCGGTPIDQTGEDILFAVNGRNIEAHVRIAYTGDAESFSWVVPVPGVPELEVGTDEVFTQLGFATSPSWNLEVGDAKCDWPYVYGGWGKDEADADGGGPNPGNSGPPAVEVLAEISVGAYEAVVLSADDPQALLDWLNCNEYRIANSALPRVQAYIDGNMNFLGLKLRQGAGTGELTPIVMRYVAPQPVIPLVLTAVAVQPNLRIRAYFLGDNRAVPTNYDHVWLNDARVDWMNGTWWAGPWAPQNYESLITAAVDEAGGKAFVTDFAGNSGVMANRIFREGGYDVDALRLITDPVQFVQEALWMGLPRNAVMQGLLRTHIPMPQELIDQGVEERDFYNNLAGYQQYLGAFDPNAFVDDIVLLLLDPMESAQELFDNANFTWLSRLQSTISGWEMNADPAFAFLEDAIDPDAGQVTDFPHQGAVAAQRWATQDFLGGEPGVSCWSAAAVVNTLAGVQPILQFPDNQKVLPDFPVAADLPLCTALPAAMVVERYDEQGGMGVIADHRAAIAAAAPDGYCVPAIEDPAPVEAPDDVEWPPLQDLLPLEEMTEEYCAQLEAGGTTLDDDPNLTTGEISGSPAACSGCAGSLAGGGSSLLGLLLMGGLRRRRQ